MKGQDQYYLNDLYAYQFHLLLKWKKNRERNLLQFTIEFEKRESSPIFVRSSSFNLFGRLPLPFPSKKGRITRSESARSHFSLEVTLEKRREVERTHRASCEGCNSGGEWKFGRRRRSRKDGGAGRLVGGRCHKRHRRALTRRRTPRKPSLDRSLLAVALNRIEDMN